MQVDGLALALRPRPMGEAADLGVRLVQANARSVWRTFTPVFLAVMLIGVLSQWVAPWLPMVMIFWLKPWLDRSILFVLSRAVFGQPTRLIDLWRAQRPVWWQGGWHTLTRQRLSPWRAFTQSIEQLEGQRGLALVQRRRQLLIGQHRAAYGLQLVFVHVEMTLSLGLLLFLMTLHPRPGGILEFFQWPAGSDSLSASMLQFGTYAVVVLALEPFFVGAGFAMYLNRRVQLESWDIEQEFRRAFA